MNSGLVVENLNYKDILNNINFTLNESSINALIGKNGSGKTTLLKCLIHILDFSGSININGNIDKKQIGAYFGIYNLEKTNSFANMIEPLINLEYDYDKAKKKVYEMSRKLGIENLLYKEIESLSLAQKKVIAFAKSIIHEPKVVLIDNLFESLDTYYKNKLISYLKFLKKSKKSIILFTTYSGEDLLLCDNLILINKGKIVIQDEVKKILENQNLFSKNNVNMPFIIDLSHKLKAYELIDNLIYDYSELVDKIWQ